MKERPILFSGTMVKAIFDGRKTQTRRVMRLQPTSPATIFDVAGGLPVWAIWPSEELDDAGHPKDHGIKCPYGRPGDRLWVREAWRITTKDNHPTLGYRFGEQCVPGYHGTRMVGGLMLSWAELKRCDDCWRPSIHMPRWASRITLEITAVRVERLQAISEDDARAEGCTGNCPVGNIRAHKAGPFSYEYAQLWDKINGDGSWAANPWVWVVEFRKVATP